MNRFGLPLLVFLILIGFLGIGLTLNPRELPSPLLGKPSPAFSAPRLLAPQQNFYNAQMNGEVWLLNVWASWCVACRTEHALLMHIAQHTTVRLVGLNYKDDAADAVDWLQRFGNPYSIIAVDRNGDIGIDYGVYGVPETYLLDKTGHIRFKQVGPLTTSTLQSLLQMIEKLHEETL